MSLQRSVISSLSVAQAAAATWKHSSCLRNVCCCLVLADKFSVRLDHQEPKIGIAMRVCITLRSLRKL